MTHEEFKEGYKIAVEDAVFWLEEHLDKFKTEDGRELIFFNKKDFIEAFKKAMNKEEMKI